MTAVDDVSDLDLDKITQDDLLHLIRGRIAAHPRSLQTRIGPSEVGTPCTRKLGHKLAGTPERERGTPWRPTVGTAVHNWLEETISAYEATRASQGLPQRYHVEQRVTVGDIDSTDITGSCDLFDAITGTVVDWKIVGPTSLKKYRGGPNHTYRVQAHLYGLGWVNAGFDVREVSLFVLPSAGELHDAVFWHEPFDVDLAQAAMQRASAIAKAGRLAGWDRVLPGLATADDFCTHCSFFVANTTDLVTGCPGHAGRIARRDPLNDLVA